MSEPSETDDEGDVVVSTSNDGKKKCRNKNSIPKVLGSKIKKEANTGG